MTTIDHSLPNGDTKVTFLAAGSMGSAIMSGLLAAGFDAGNIRATTRSQDSAAKLADRYGIVARAGGTANRDAAEWADVVVLGVKPHQVTDVLGEIEPVVSADGPLIISVAAGITLDIMAQATSAPLVRAMPNTPSLIGHGVIGLSGGSEVAGDRMDLAAEVLGSAGTVVSVDESQLDALTAISGSGPAYFFAFTEALIAAGERLGLHADTARALAVGTAEGAGALMDASDSGPAVLRGNVTSPGGTTEAALQVLSAGGLDELVAGATKAAAERSRELAGPNQP